MYIQKERKIKHETPLDITWRKTKPKIIKYLEKMDIKKINKLRLMSDEVVNATTFEEAKNITKL